MNSPFPGMDPFIEINPRWEGIHGWFIRKLAELSMPRARELGYWVDVERTVYQRVKQDYLVVRELSRFSRVVAVVEVLSPANKKGNYVERYREKRRRFLATQTHFMEIDFLRDGDNLSRDAFPELPAAPYFIFRARKTGVGRNEEGIPLRLQDPLPSVGLPLASSTADLPLDLGAAFRAAFDLSIQTGSIDYSGEQIPPPELAKEDAEWVERLLREKGFPR